jgi:hypothetical protein
MSGVLSVLGALGATALVFLLWFLVVIVIPGVIAVYVSMLFPLTGQWRKRWAERRMRRRP